MMDIQLKERIQGALKVFARGSLRDCAINLLNVLGYVSERRVELPSNTAAAFLAEFDPQQKLNRFRALITEWRSVDMLFQLTGAEVAGGAQRRLPFHAGQVDNTVIESYLFLAIELSGRSYTRTQLAAVTREVNKLFPMPVMLIFRHGDSLSLAVIDRRLNRRDPSRDVLEKVTLIKDIAFNVPGRAHIEILHDLSLAALHEEFNVQSFVELHEAWEKRLDTSHLNERFYRDIANWYFWAQQHPGLVPPRDVEGEDERSIFLIRLITRLIFCWFLQEKGLIPRDLFRPRALGQLLKDTGDHNGTYYKAILQNLFFATLNQKIEDRGFRRYNQSGGRDANRGVTNLYRYCDLFRDPQAFVEQLNSVPFVNGGLFDCLDRVYRNAERQSNVRLDDFSDEKDNRLCIPNELFFGNEHRVDLSEVYQDRHRRQEKVRPIIEILSGYKFTVEENTPLEQEIALDPELLGKVFENLLASYNEETSTTARKATGSFYTPREVVSFMVDEALIAFLSGKLRGESNRAKAEGKLRQLFEASPDSGVAPLSAAETDALMTAIDGIKILDPACGSGAFPMGALQRLVDLLNKVDADNKRWKQKQLERAESLRAQVKLARHAHDKTARLSVLDAYIKDIEHSFDTRYHAADFARKLYLIENSVFGVDIQPIACQIAKLRFFITLAADQKVNPSAPNLGVRPLPNLETNLVAADALMPIERSADQFDLFDGQLDALRKELALIRHQLFNARTPERKQRYREKDALIRSQLTEVLTHGGLPGPTAARLAGWDPFDQNRHASFFDPAWMFSVADGFDVVIGNPPYVRHERITDLKPQLRQHYECFKGTADLYVYFYERGVQLLREDGAFSFISSNKWFRSAYGEKLREWLATHTRIKSIIDFGDAPVFTAIAYPCIVTLTKDGSGDSHQSNRPHNEFPVLNWQAGPPVEEFVRIFREQSFTVPQSSLRRDGWRLESRAKLKLLERIRAAGMPLGEYVRGRFYYGIKTGLNEAFVIDRGTRDQLIADHPSSAESIKPFLRGRDVKRWKADFADQYLIKIECSENKRHLWRGKSKAQAEKTFGDTYPAIYEHFRPLRSRLIDRYDQGKYFWELRGCAYWQEFERPKIVYPDIALVPQFAWDEQDHYLANTLYLIPTDRQFLLAILNSNLNAWFYAQISPRIQQGYLRFIAQYCSQIPVPRLNKVQEQMLERLVGYQLWLYRTPDSSNGNAGIPLTSNYIQDVLNGLVYELFFPEELHARRLFLFDHLAKAELPALESLSKSKRAAALQEAFDRIYEGNHPIRECLSSLCSLPIVRMIEGEREEEASVIIPLESTDEPDSRRPRRSGVRSSDSLVPA